MTGGLTWERLWGALLSYGKAIAYAGTVLHVVTISEPFQCREHLSDASSWIWLIRDAQNPSFYVHL